MNPRYAQGQHEGVVAPILKAVQNSIRSSLRILHGGKGPYEICANAIGGEDQQVSLSHGKHCGLQLGKVVADDAPSQQEGLWRAGLLVGAHQDSVYISDTEPGHQAVPYVNGSKTQNDSSRRTQFLVARSHQRNDWFPNAISQYGDRSFGGIGGLGAVPDSIDCGN
jgi:hypothetical protein